MSEKMTEKEKVAIIKYIRQSIDAEKVSYGEISFLMENTQVIKKHFPNDPVLWQWAGLSEEEYLNQ